MNSMGGVSASRAFPKSETLEKPYTAGAPPTLSAVANPDRVETTIQGLFLLFF
jgi:hypothetical protein